MSEIKGKTAFITGAASGIGLAMAEAFAAEGARVVLADIDRPRLEAAVAAIGGEALAVELDVRDRDAWARAKAAAEARFGPVDILCNNAGIGGDGREFADMQPEAFDRMIDINLIGVFSGVRTFVGEMAKRGQGHVVNVASLAGLVHLPRIGAYCAAKAGVVAISDSLRAEVEPLGVQVTVLCPGKVATRVEETTRAAGSERPAPGRSPSLARQTLQPETVARAVIGAVRSNRPYVITHAEYREHFQAWAETILAAFDRGMGA